jgi:hypothetical protein
MAGNCHTIPDWHNEFAVDRADSSYAHATT